MPVSRTIFLYTPEIALLVATWAPALASGAFDVRGAAVGLAAQVMTLTVLHFSFISHIFSRSKRLQVWSGPQTEDGSTLPCPLARKYVPACEHLFKDPTFFEELDFSIFIRRRHPHLFDSSPSFFRTARWALEKHGGPPDSYGTSALLHPVLRMLVYKGASPADHLLRDAVRTWLLPRQFADDVPDPALPNELLSAVMEVLALRRLNARLLRFMLANKSDDLALGPRDARGPEKLALLARGYALAG
ncbi:hypothetical protein DFJ74DRAFT_705924 [Hyaloraphidium curvatum]|nr:hypothetical protein DFJ74DRAFT_705924 [Hyaloraphidium curvatum]